MTDIIYDSKVRDLSNDSSDDKYNVELIYVFSYTII